MTEYHNYTLTKNDDSSEAKVTLSLGITEFNTFTPIAFVYDRLPCNLKFVEEIRQELTKILGETSTPVNLEYFKQLIKMEFFKSYNPLFSSGNPL
jgi:hypothetical protein